MVFKKFFAVLSSAALSLTMLSAMNVSANLPQTPDGGNNCNLSFEMTSQGAFITGAYTDEGEPADEIEQIIIPEKTEAGIPVIGIKGFAFAECQCLKSVVVPATVNNIDDAAFLRTQDINTFLNERNLNLLAVTEADLAYAANIVEYMGRKDWNGTEPELENAKTVFTNVRNTITNGNDNVSMGKTAQLLYNHQDLSDIVRSADENTLEKMSLKSYEAFLAWTKTVTYLDTTVIADEDSYAAQYAKGKEILGLKYQATQTHLLGDANQDGAVNVRDAAWIARALATGKVDEMITCKICADYNEDGTVNVRDAAAIARFLASKKD